MKPHLPLALLKTILFTTFINFSASTSYAELILANGITGKNANTMQGWHDLNKAWTGGQSNSDYSDDSNLCWASCATNLIQGWQDHYIFLAESRVNQEQTVPNGFVEGREPDGSDNELDIRNSQIFEVFTESWENEAWYLNSGLRWWFTQDAKDASYLLKDNTTGGYWKQFFTEEEIESCFQTSFFGSSITPNQLADRFVELMQQTETGVGICVNWTQTSTGKTGAHEVVVWGIQTNSSGELTYIYITDSDDRETAIKKLKIVYQDNQIYIEGFMTGCVSVLSYFDIIVTPEALKKAKEEYYNNGLTWAGGKSGEWIVDTTTDTSASQKDGWIVNANGDDYYNRFTEGKDIRFTADNAGTVSINSTIKTGNITLETEQGKDYTFSGTGGLTGDGITVTKNGSGNWNIYTNNNYTGTTHLSGGTILAGSNSAFGSSDLILDQSTSLDLFGSQKTGTLTLNNFTWDGSVIFDILSPTDYDSITITGSFSSNNTRDIILNGDLSAGTYTLMTASEAFTFTGFNLIWSSGDLGKYNYGLGLSEDGKSLVLTIVGEFPDLDGNYLVVRPSEISSSETLNLSGIDSVYITGTVTPKDIIVNYDQTTTISGIGSISGEASLNKEGSGTLVINNTNTYTGGTILKEGTLRTESTQALGLGSITQLGGILDLTNKALSNNIYATSGILTNASTYEGTLTVGSPTLEGGLDSEAELANTTYKIQGAASVHKLILENGTLTSLTSSENDSLSAQEILAKQGTIALNLKGKSSIVKDGSGTLTLSGLNTHTGATIINDGTLIVASNTALGSGNITLNGGQLNLNNYNVTNDIVITQDSTLNQASSYQGNLTINSGSLTLVGASSANQVELNSGALSGDSLRTNKLALSEGTLNISLSGNTTITKTGEGSVSLTKDSTQTGTFSILQGSVSVETEQALGNSTILLAKGTLNLTNKAVTNTITVTGNSELLGGEGYNGILTVESGSLLLHNLTKAQYVILTNGDLLGGTLSLTSSSADINGSTTTQADLTLKNGTITSTITGDHIFVEKITSGTVTLSGNNTYSGETQLSDGTLTAGSDTAFGSSTINVLGGTLNLNDFELSNSIIVSQKATLQGASRFTGNLTLNQQTLTLGENTQLGSFTIVQGTLTGGSFSTKTITAESGLIQSLITGSTTLTKTSSGQLTLTGANSYKGSTIIQDGILMAGDEKAFGTSKITLSGGTLDLNNYTISNTITATGGILANAQQYQGSLYIQGGLTLTGTTKASQVTLNLNEQQIVTGGAFQNSSILAYSGIIQSQLTGTTSITKISSQTLTLDHDNTYTGGTTLSEGTLITNSQKALGTGKLTLTGGTLDLNNFAIANDIGSSNTATISQASAYAGNITVSSGLLIFDGTASALSLTLRSGTITGDALRTSSLSLIAGTLDVALVGEMNITKTGSGTTTLSHASTHTGTTTLSQGTLLLTANEALGKSNILLKEGILNLNGKTASNVITIEGSGTLAGANNFTGSLNITDGGSLTLTQATTSNALILTEGKLSGSTLTINNLENSSNTVHVSLIKGTIDSTLIGENILIEKTGTNSVTLSGNNTYSGETRLSQGTLIANSNVAFGTSTITLAGGTLNLNSKSLNNTINVTQESILTGANLYTGQLTLNQATLTLNDDTSASNVTIVGGTLNGGTLSTSTLLGQSGIINTKLTGNLQFTKSTTGQLTLNGDNTFSGTTVIENGTLILGNQSALGSSDILLKQGTLDLKGFALTNNITVQGGTLSNAQLFTGNLTLSGTLSLDGTISAKQVTIALDETNRLSGGIIKNTSILAQSGLVQTQLTGTTSLTKSTSGNLTLSGNNSYSGGTIIQEGTLTLGSQTALGSGQVFLQGGTLDLHHYSLTNNITVTQQSTLNQASNYRGSLTITSGTLSLQGETTAKEITLTEGSIIGDGTLQTDALTLHNGTLSVTLIGTTNITKVGEGCVTLTQASTHSGLTTLSHGTLILGHQQALGNSSVLITKGTLDLNNHDIYNTLTVNGEAILNNAGNFAGELELTKGSLIFSQESSARSLTLSGGVISGEKLTLTPQNNDSNTVNVNLLQGTIACDLTGKNLVIQKSSQGNVILSGNNSFSGTIYITEGSLQANSTTAFGTTNLILAGGTLQLSHLQLANNLTVTHNSLLKGADQYVGNLTISQGTLTLEDQAKVSSLTMKGGTLTGGTLSTSSIISQSGVINSQLIGATTLTQQGSGELILSGNNSYTGSTIVESGTLTAGSQTAFGNSIITLNQGILNLGGYALSNTITAYGGTISQAQLFVGHLNLIGDITLSGITSAQQVCISQNATITNGSFMNTLIEAQSGTINSQITGSSSVTKTTTDTFDLTGNNTYTGTTTVNQGKLIVSGALTQSKVTVGSQGTLVITGSVDKNITLNEGALLDIRTGMTLKTGQRLSGGHQSGSSTDILGNLTTAKGSTLTINKTLSLEGNLNLNGGVLSLETSSLLQVSGNVSLTSPTYIALTGDDWKENTSYTLGEFGSLTGSLDNIIFDFSDLGFEFEDYGLTFRNNTLTVIFNTAKHTDPVDRPNTTLTWIGGDNIWKNNGDSGLWLNTKVADQRFTQGDAVIFASDAELTIFKEVTPSSILVQGKANITFTGNGCISGTGALTMKSTGVLIIDTDNTYTGGTFITAGTVRTGANNALGTGKITLSKGTLDLQGSQLSNEFINTGSNLIIAGEQGHLGQITNTNTLNISGILTTDVFTMAKGSLLGGELSAQLLNISSGTISTQLTGSGSLNKTASGTLTLLGEHSYSGTTTISSGSVLIDGSLTQSNINTEDKISLTVGKKQAGYIGGNLKLGNSNSLTINKESTVSGTITAGQSFKLTTTSSTLKGNISTEDKANLSFKDSKTQSFTLANYATLKGTNLTINGSLLTLDFANITLSGTSSVQQDITLGLGSKFTSSASIDGAITAGDKSSLTLKGTQTVHSITLGDESKLTLSTSVDGNITVGEANTLSLSGLYSVNGKLTAGDKAKITSSVAINDNVEIGNDFSLSFKTGTIDGNFLTGNTGKLSLSSSVTGYLTVGDDVSLTLGSNQTIEGAVTVGNNTKFSSSATLNNGLTVLNNFSISQKTGGINGNLIAGNTGKLSLSSSVTGCLTVGDDVSLTLGSNQTIEGAVTVGNNTKFSSSATLNNGLTVLNNFSISQKTGIINGNLIAGNTGKISLSSSVSGQLTVGDDVSLTLGSKQTIKGAVTLGNNIKFTSSSILENGLTALDNFNISQKTGQITGNVTTGNTGTLSLGSALTGNLSVGNNVIIKLSGLGITGSLTGGQNVSLSSSTSISETITLNDNAIVSISGNNTTLSGGLQTGHNSKLTLSVSSLQGGLTAGDNTIAKVTTKYGFDGDINLGNSSNLSVSSTVKGDITLGDNSTISITAKEGLLGDLTVGKKSAITTNGLIQGNISLGTESTLKITGKELILQKDQTLTTGAFTGNSTIAHITGNLNLNGGNLDIGGTNTLTALNLKGNLTLTSGNLYINGQGSNIDSFNISGKLTLAGSTNILFSGNIADGSYVLGTFGSFVGDLSLLTLNGFDTGNYSFSLDGKKLILKVNGIHTLTTENEEFISTLESGTTDNALLNGNSIYENVSQEQSVSTNQTNADGFAENDKTELLVNDSEETKSDLTSEPLIQTLANKTASTTFTEKENDDHVIQEDDNELTVETELTNDSTNDETPEKDAGKTITLEDLLANQATFKPVKQAFRALPASTLWGSAQNLQTITDNIFQNNNRGILDNDGRSSVWATSLNNFIKVRDNGEQNGYNYQSNGYALGTAYTLTPDFTTSLAFAQTLGKNNLNNSLGQIDQDMLALSAHTDWVTYRDASNTLTLNFTTSYGRSTNKGYVLHETGNLNGTWHDDSWNVVTQIQWSTQLKKDLTLQTFAGIEYTTAKQDRFQLTNTTTTTLDYGKGRIGTLRTPVGIGLTQNTEWGSTHKLTSFINTSLVPELSRTSPHSTITQGENTWTTSGSEPGHMSYEVQIGFVYQCDPQWFTQVSYQFEATNQSQTHSINAGITYKF